MPLNDNRSFNFARSARWTHRLNLLVLALLCGATAGCTKREKVLDIQTPAGSVEVNQTTSPSGAKGIEIDTSENSRIEIDATQKKD